MRSTPDPHASLESQTEALLLRHFEKYPGLQVTDALKLLYQGEFGCGHMAPEEDQSLAMILAELESLLPHTLGNDFSEPVGGGLCRLYLRVLRETALSPATLNRFFLLTASRPQGSGEAFEQKARLLARLCGEGLLPFDGQEVSFIAAELCASGYPPPRHSGHYRSRYAPAYRVVDERFCDFLPLFCRIDELAREKARVLIAIDGDCAAGKSTLAALLREVYACNVFSMDSFFLRPHQRTQKRLAEPGGNVDRERFKEEVLEPLLAGEAFSYRPYDCSVRELAEEVSVEPKPLNVVEGVYSLHPELSDAYDLKVFLTLDPEKQADRLFERNPAMSQRFAEEWIPLEHRYFEAFDVPARCDLLFRT